MNKKLPQYLVTSALFQLHDIEKKITSTNETMPLIQFISNIFRILAELISDKAVATRHSEWIYEHDLSAVISIYNVKEGEGGALREKTAMPEEKKVESCRQCSGRQNLRGPDAPPLDSDQPQKS